MTVQDIKSTWIVAFMTTVGRGTAVLLAWTGLRSSLSFWLLLTTTMRWSSIFTGLLAFESKRLALGLASWPGWCLPCLEHAFQEINSRVHLPLSVASSVVLLRALPSEFDPRRNLLWQNRLVGQPQPQKDPSPTESAFRHGAHGKYHLQSQLSQQVQSTLVQHPVYCLSVVGTQNSHSLISISTDGKMCSWSLDMLAQPQETLDLQQRQSRAVAATCMAFPQPTSDINNFVVGSEEGIIYSGTSVIFSFRLRVSADMWCYQLAVTDRELA